MPLISRFSCLSALMLAVSVTGSHADVTAADVWADWQDYMASTGYAVTGNEAASGSDLTVTDMVMSVDFEDETGTTKVRIVMDEVMFAGNADGSVTIRLPEASAFDIETAGAEGEDVKITVDYAQAAPQMTATGDPGDVTYDYSADTVTMRLSNLNVDGVILTEEIAKFLVTMNTVGYRTRISAGDVRTLDQSMQASSLEYDIRFTDPAGEGNFALAGSMDGLGFEGDGTLPLETNPEDLNAMLNDGFAFAGTFTTTGGQYDLNFKGPDGSGTINSTSTGAKLDLAMDPSGIAYAVEQAGLAVNMLLTELPLPISFSAATTAVDMRIPVQKSTEEQDFGMVVTLRDFAMSDMIWSIFDPAAQLPRDPATIVVDLTGKAKVLFDILDPAQAAILEQADAAPGELNALTLNTLEVDAVGAKLTGSGDFTFDNSDLVTFDGMPRPQGALDLTLVGGNALIDKLNAMGLLPEEQAMGARMMLGLFAVPGGAEDTLTSKIEVNEAGHVLANGQRLR